MVSEPSGAAPSQHEPNCSSLAPNRPSIRGGSQVAAQGRPAVDFGIRRPRDGSIFALDPDIPPQAQRIVFEGEPGTWLLNDKPIGKGRTLTWQPWPGRHHLSLRGDGGRIVQRVQFEVRGARIKAAGSPVPGSRPRVNARGE